MNGAGPLRIVVSACLLGCCVRYDGTSKYAPALLRGVAQAARELHTASSRAGAQPSSCCDGCAPDAVSAIRPVIRLSPPLAPYSPAPPLPSFGVPGVLEWLAVCPEAECGLPVPREPMHLAEPVLAPRLMTCESRIEHTGRLCDFTRERLAQLAEHAPDAAILKAKSPSCGMRNIPVYGESGCKRVASTPGLFAAALLRAFPLIPAAEETELAHPASWRPFVARILRAREKRAGLSSRWKHVFRQGNDVFPL